MKFVCILSLLFLCACSSLEQLDVFGKKEREEQEKIQSEELQRKQLFLTKRNLKNTINLRIGQTQNEVINILLDPMSVSAEKEEVVWHYNLLQYPSMEAPLSPFKVIFKNDKVVKFGIDQEQIERDRAKVIIQKEMANDKSVKD